MKTFIVQDIHKKIISLTRQAILDNRCTVMYQQSLLLKRKHWMIIVIGFAIISLIVFISYHYHD